MLREPFRQRRPAIAPGFECDLSRAVGPQHDVYRLDQMRRFWSEFAQSWESVRIEPHEFKLLSLRDTARAMSEGNVEMAGLVLDALAQRDVERLVDLSDPDVRWHSFFAEVAFGAGGGYRGHDGIRQYVSDLNDAWEIVRADVDDGLAVGDIALLVGRIHYRGKASGVETASPAGWMFKFRDGKVLRFRAFREPAQVLEDAGLSE